MPFDRASYTREYYRKRFAVHDYARDWIKSCRICGTAKSVREFYRLPAMADGYTNECKACRRQWQRERWAANAEALRVRSREIRDRAARSMGDKAARAANPEKFIARRLLNRAVSRGLLTRGPCECCGAPETQGHHDDYSKPLDVRWLCPVHHGALRRKYA